MSRFMEESQTVSPMPGLGHCPDRRRPPNSLDKPSLACLQGEEAEVSETHGCQLRASVWLNLGASMRCFCFSLQSKVRGRLGNLTKSPEHCQTSAHRWPGRPESPWALLWIRLYYKAFPLCISPLKNPRVIKVTPFHAAQPISWNVYDQGSFKGWNCTLNYHYRRYLEPCRQSPAPVPSPLPCCHFLPALQVLLAPSEGGAGRPCRPTRPQWFYLFHMAQEHAGTQLAIIFLLISMNHFLIMNNVFRDTPETFRPRFP